MTPDTMRIEAGLIARNQAQAAQSRHSGEGFSSALEEISRGLSAERPSAETSMRAPETERPVGSEQPARPANESGTSRKAEGRTRDGEKDTVSDTETSEQRQARQTEGKKDTPRPQDPAELRRILQRLQHTQARPSTQTGPSQPQALEEPEEAGDAGAQGKLRSALQAQASLSDDAEPGQDDAGLGGLVSLTGTTIEPGQGHVNDRLRGLSRGQAEETSPDRGRKGLAHTSLVSGTAGPAGRTAPDAQSGPGASGTARSEAGHGLAKASTPGATKPGAESGLDFSAIFQRGQEAMLSVETSLRNQPDSSAVSLATHSESPGSGMAAASLLAGALQGATTAGASASNGTGQAFQAGPTQWALSYAPGETHFGEALGERLSWMVRDGLQQAEITLNPQELGPIRIALTMEGDAAQLGIQAEHALTRQAIEEALPRLKSLLADQGVQLGQTAVGQGSEHDSRGSDPQARKEGRLRGHESAVTPDGTTPLDGTVRTGQMALRPGRGRIDVFA
ncbi:MAG: flagellar hook-length control protein FliK, partial [Burkholderiaceae bacterium]